MKVYVVEQRLHGWWPIDNTSFVDKRDAEIKMEHLEASSPELRFRVAEYKRVPTKW